MKTWKSVWFVFALAAILGVAGCSSDDDPVQLPTVLNEAYVGAMVDEFVGPMVDAATQVGWLLLNLPKAKDPGCTPITGVCDTGTVEYCPDVSSADLVFDQCFVDEWTFDGTITVTPTGLDTYYVVFDLDMNGIPLIGGVSIDATQPPCIYEVFDNLTAMDSGITASMTGGLTVCTTSDYPSGQLTMWITDPTLGLLRMEMDANGKPVIIISLYDSLDEYVGDCSYNIDTEAVTCVFD